MGFKEGDIVEFESELYMVDKTGLGNLINDETKMGRYIRFDGHKREYRLLYSTPFNPIKEDYAIDEEDTSYESSLTLWIDDFKITVKK